MSDFDLRRKEQPGLSAGIPGSSADRAGWGLPVSAALHAGILFLLAGFGAPATVHAPESPIEVTFVEPRRLPDLPPRQAVAAQMEDASADAMLTLASEPAAPASPPQAFPDAVLPAPHPADTTTPAAAKRPAAKSLQSNPADEKPAEAKRSEAKPQQAKLQKVAKSSPPPSDVAVKTPPEQVKSEYAGLIQTIIGRNRVYPADAQAARLEGTAVVHFLLMADGKIRNLTIAQSSGHDILDRAAKDTIRRSSPFPPIPAAFGTDRIDMRLNMNYKMD